MGHSCESLLSRLLNKRFAQDFLKNSHVESAKRAFRSSLPPKFTLQSSKTSVSYETSSKTRASSLQNEHFVRDFLQKLRVCKTSVSYETSSKSHASSLPSNNARSHANPNVTATFTSATPRNLTIPCACHETFRITSNVHKVLRLPRNVTSITPCNLTIPCACHENRTSTPQSPHKVLQRLPRKVITPHHTFNPPKLPFQLRLVTKTD